MDDLFFNDSRSGGDKRPPKKTTGGFRDENELNESGDIFSGSAFADGDKGGFRVTLPDEEKGKAEPYNPRAPKGRPVGEARRPAQSGGIPPAQGAPNSRTPKGRPLASPQSGMTDVYSSAEAERGGSQAPGSETGSNGVPREERGANNAPSRPVQRRPSPPAPRNGKKPPAKEKPQKKSKGKIIAAAVISVIVLLLASLFAYGYNLLGKINYESSALDKNEYISEKELASSPDVRNILLIGSDARNEIQGQRSDTMILFSIDKKNKQIKLTSFLRDSYVCIPSTGRYRKLNAACSSGGAQLVRDTIEYNFKVKIDSYIFVDFEAFVKLIDLMGGLTVKDVTAKEAKYLRDVVKITYAKEGTNKFSGAAALWYCRIRYLDNDFYRTERQRKVISAVIDQASKMSPFKLLDIVEQILPMITTDIKRSDMLSLGIGAATQYIRYDIVQHQIPAKGTWTNKRVYGEGDVLAMDIDKNAKLLEKFVYSKVNQKEEK